ncbi:hypothetical protein B0H14DRAFT_2555960 [Mycena olivaceomarginata]|nr:hypothetical protein B0H14DRAFT_2555960 [Mycena olivaceomarginata]
MSYRVRVIISGDWRIIEHHRNTSNQNPEPCDFDKICGDSRQPRDRDTTGYGTGSVQLVGEGAATRLRDEEEEPQETGLDHSAPFPWTDEEIDWFIDAEDG